jgi:hypothetical protein
VWEVPRGRESRRARPDPTLVEYEAVMAYHWTYRIGRARRADAAVYQPEPGEWIRAAHLPGQKFRFIRFASDSGGDYAVIIGGPPGHRMERCVTVDKIEPYRRRLRRPFGVVSNEARLLTNRNDDDGRGTANDSANT